MGKFVILVLSLFILACQPNGGEKSSKSQNSACGAKKYFKEYWTWQMKTYPTWASMKGWGERHNRFYEQTVENIQKTHNEVVDHLKNVKQLLAKKSCSHQKVSLSLLVHKLQNEVSGHKFESYLMPFDPLGGPHTDVPQLYRRVPLKTLQNYQDLLERMSKIPKMFEQAKALSLLGLKKGLVPPKVTFKNYESSMLDLSTGDVEKSPFYKPFEKLHDSLSAVETRTLRVQAKKTIAELIQPAYKNLYDFWMKDYYPNLRETIAVSDLPKGTEFYKFRIKRMTTLDKTAKEIHEIGMGEVRRILAEMEVIKDKVKFKGTIQDFFKNLRTNKKFYAKTEDELFAKAAVSLKKMDGKLPELFRVLPRLPYGIEPIPKFIAHKSPAAYYGPGNMKIGQAGIYKINLSNLKSRPLYNVMALSLHEAVPGHHLQIALAQELEDLPEFRKNGGETAFSEGWGLYAESLGKMVGMYADPYDDFGRLTYEQWRAMRLVVDTGLHAFGWSRDKAIEFMKSNSGLSEKNIVVEVDRYINWPGQALAYKMGELKIKELRERAKKKLGKKYDIRDFHHEVLKEGSIPLPVLEQNIDNYINKTS